VRLEPSLDELLVDDNEVRDDDGVNDFSGTYVYDEKLFSEDDGKP
jgi:hypothetical protein